jgi:hypothetical protein
MLEAQASGIVASIVKAPITPDGDVAYAATDFVINLDISPDPSLPGRTLLAGKKVRITLPDEFVNLGGPVLNPGAPPSSCPAAAGTCSTGVLLQGWPQRPIPPSPANYTVSLGGANVIEFTATRDLVVGDPTLNGPGLKQIHLILRNFVNPNPGVYPIMVEAETGPAGAVETGVGRLFIHPNDRASINVTSVFVGGQPTIYQDTGTNSNIPLLWNFLVWDKRGEPAVGVKIRQINGRRAQLVQGNHVVGQIKIHAPKGAKGQEIGGGPSSEINGPVLNLPTGRLIVDFKTGNKPGLYTIILKMNNGTSLEMFVTAI